VGALLVPLLGVFARQLWLVADAEAHDDEVPLYAQHWVRPTAVLVVGMGLLACALSLGFHDYDGTLPASPGGIGGCWAPGRWMGWPVCCRRWCGCG
jgi:S-DNA-T family DNA segregation ATPase FtsK/SpoIIIE